MDRGLAVVLTAFVGGLIALQAPINGQLGRTVGSLQAAFVSFAIGTVVLLALALTARGGLSTVGEARTIPWYYLTGGLLGAAYVTTVLITVKTLGAAPVVAATIAGQLALSVVVDQLGWLGVAKDPVNASKLFGIALLGVGVWLIVRE